MSGHRKSVDDQGTYVLTPRDTEHIWHLYNIIEVDDLVGGRTYRKVQAANDTGTASNSRVAIDISVRVEKTDVDLEAGVVRVNGRNVTMSEHLKLGAYHTMELVINQTYRIHKAEWDSMNRERALKIRFLTSDGGDTTAVVMQEGLANICIVKESLTLIRQRIEMPIPRKRKGETAQHERGLQQFFEAVLEGIVRHIDLAAMRCLVLASPGFVKDKFLEHVKAAADADNKSAKMILEHRRKIELAHSASGHTNALAELLTGANAKSGGGMLSNTAMADELAAMQQFYTMLRVQPDKAFYGETHVRRAAAENAIETLLVSDSLFRSTNVRQRKAYIDLVDEVKGSGGTVKILSSKHAAGEQLTQLTGVAALLRYPLPELNDDEDESEPDSSDDEEGG